MITDAPMTLHFEFSPSLSSQGINNLQYISCSPKILSDSSKFMKGKEGKWPKSLSVPQQTKEHMHHPVSFQSFDEYKDILAYVNKKQIGPLFPMKIDLW